MRVTSRNRRARSAVEKAAAVLGDRSARRVEFLRASMRGDVAETALPSTADRIA